LHLRADDAGLLIKRGQFDELPEDWLSELGILTEVNIDFLKYLQQLSANSDFLKHDLRLRMRDLPICDADRDKNSLVLLVVIQF
jgi:hypothetical protein